ncbi:hypothetical protein OG612_37500 [Streptomyces sp. NBC_01527]
MTRPLRLRNIPSSPHMALGGFTGDAVKPTRTESYRMGAEGLPGGSA